MHMLGTMWTAHGLFVESLVSELSGGGLLGRQVLRLGRVFIAVIFVPELRSAVARADREVHALAAPVPICKRAIEILGIGWIRVAEPIPAFPDAVNVGVMEIEHWVTADGCEVGHVAAECKVSQEMRVEVESRIKSSVAGRRVDVNRLVIERAAGNPEYGRHDQIGDVSGDWVPVG